MLPLMTTVEIVSCDQASHFAPHFDHLDLRNAMVPLIMPVPMASDDQKHVVPNFKYLDQRNAVISQKVMLNLILIVLT